MTAIKQGVFMAKEKNKKLWGATSDAKKKIEDGYDPFAKNKTTGCANGKCAPKKNQGAKDEKPTSVI